MLRIVIFVSTACLVLSTSYIECQHGESSSDDNEAHSNDEGSTRTEKVQELKGPSTFFDGSNFFLKVRDAIVLTVHETDENVGNVTVTKIKLDKEATTLSGSMISREQFKLNIGWKGESFVSNSLRVEMLALELEFQKRKKVFTLNSLGVAKVELNGKTFKSSDINPVSRSGEVISAPIGLTFSCEQLGEFKPMKDKKLTATNENESQEGSKTKFGIILPSLKLRVFNVESATLTPLWECGSLFPIGFWIGIILTLFFAFICYWGFSMLANINTMDRFDDPKGRAIHVPTSD